MLYIIVSATQEIIAMINKDRVKFWNSLFYSAWESTKTVFEAQNNRKSSKSFDPVGGRATADQEIVLRSLLFTTLAIESRVNHLIIELAESRKISDSESRAIQQLNIKDKWFVLPKIAGKQDKFDASKPPHQAIVEICAIRNSLIHVSFNQLHSKLPTKNKMVSLFQQFVLAMENMNVVLGRVRKYRKRVIDISKF